MIRRPGDESIKRREQKDEESSKCRKNCRASFRSRKNRKHGSDLSARKHIAAADVSVEKSSQRIRNKWLQTNESRAPRSKREPRQSRDREFKSRVSRGNRSICSHINGAGLAEKKRSLGLVGDLRGRHLTARERVGLLEIIELAQIEGVSCERSCKVLELNSRAVYRWKSDGVSKPHGGGGGQNKILDDEETKVVEWARRHPEQRCRRIAYELERAGIVFIGKTKVAAILKKHELNHPFVRGAAKADIVPQDMLLHEPWRRNLLWGMDWTWVRVNGKFMFLVVLLDWYSRKILSWGLFWQITRIEVVSVVTDAVAVEEIEALPENALRPIVVADHGSANTCRHTKANIEVLGLELWLSGVGRPTGNARTERVIGTLKREEILLQDEYKKEKEAQRKIGYSIFDYNNLRPNAGNGGFAPSIVHQHGRRLLTEQRIKYRQKSEIERRNYWKQYQGSPS